MNSRTQQEPLEITIGDAVIRVPREAAVMAYLEQLIDQRRPLPVAFTESLEGFDRALRMHDIGDVIDGQVYAGVTIFENKPCHLWLLSGDHDDFNWDKAKAWAKEQGGVLPSRVDALVLFQNLKGEFKEAAYWTGEAYTPAAGFAWYQSFYDGCQGYYLQGDDLRARAVRRVPI